MVDRKISSICCISHCFYQSASTNPTKIAVVHARRGAHQIYDHNNTHQSLSTESSSGSTGKSSNEFSETESNSSYPPVFQGDECFTLSDVMAGVDSLSSRLRHILDGGDDRYVVKPTTTAHDQAIGVQLSTENQTNRYTPRIVGIYMIPSVEYVISVISVLRCGEAFMPLDPSWPKERILSIISSSKPHLIICQSSVYGTHLQLDGLDIPALCISFKENLRENFESSSALVWPCQKEVSRMFCYVMYTSGSSGKPKGVCGTEIGLINRFVWLQEIYPLSGDDFLLFKTSISFIDHLQEFLGPLLTSCTIVIPPFSELKENPVSIVNYLQAYSINRLVTVPSLMREILPALKYSINKSIKDSLKILVLSGEIFPISLYDTISELLPETTILNLYGSTEVSGDCTYFDCKKLPSILSTESICSVPIGSPIKNCEVHLQSDEDSSNGGEIHVSGLCLSNGYISENNSNFPSKSSHYQTGDFAIKLQSGDLVFIGRKDRTVKINGQRVSLEEIECNLRDHEDVFDAALVLNDTRIDGYLVTKTQNGESENLGSSIRSWLVEKIPLAMIPNRIFLMNSFPMSSSGKVDYNLLTSSRMIKKISTRIEDIQNSELLDLIKQAFCDSLKIDKISCDDDFFALGGDSISAAHVSHTLRINMRMIYKFPTPLMLQMTLLKDKHLLKHGLEMCSDSRPVKYLKLEPDMNLKSTNHAETFWNLTTVKFPTSFSRCNKVMRKVGYEGNNLSVQTEKRELYKDAKGFLREVWKVRMDSCVDASPLVVFRENDVYLYIGSHSHKFLCIYAKSGSVQWEVKLEGRVECSAAILGDFSQIVVGCYQGNIYFLDSLNGSISWTFQTRGDLVFIGRKDRTVKINGQRVSLEEIECNLRDHEDVFDAALVLNDTRIDGYLVTKTQNGESENLGSSIRSWLVEKIPLAMIPNRIFLMNSFPMSSSGKVDYNLLTSSRMIKKISTRIEDIQNSELLDLIKQAFCDSLKIDKISCDDDFFALGGDSISAAHVSHTLRINMRMIYKFPTPLMLQMTLLKDKHLLKHGLEMCSDSRPVKYLKLEPDMNLKSTNHAETFWNLTTVKFPTSFSRCNKVMRKVGYEGNNLSVQTEKRELYKDAKGFLREVWKVRMDSCVDASPLVVFRENDVYLYIGSHSHKFLCIYAKSGSVQWEVKLEGRVECSAAILGDFSQIVVGCYQGNIYFLDSLNGSISWTFQTRGEVKSQPIVDSERHLVWCGSYDHNIYALDYASKCCIFNLHCGGSIYGSAVIDEVHSMLYIASTSGHVTTICIKTAPFSSMWVQDLGAPIFGSLSLDSQHGNVICCLVNGDVIALDSSGSVVWRGITGGPIFAGPCISNALPSQVLICSRDGCIYSFDLGNGNLIWRHNIGDPIISAAYVDENLRLICVCTSSGRICLLRINSEINEEENIKSENLVQEYAEFDLKGDIFSSPVMINGRIFIGCRDDYIHCIQLQDPHLF